MADISADLQKILDAVYGEEVRGSIHNAIKAMNEESSAADTNASEAIRIARESEKSIADSARSIEESAELAATSAENASTSEGNAAGYATRAETAEGNARKSAENASTSETNASNSAKAAKAAETNARNLAVDALQKSRDAAVSEQATKAAMEQSKENASVASESARLAKEFSVHPPKLEGDTWWIWDSNGYQELDDSRGDAIRDSSGNNILVHAGGYVDSHIQNDAKTAEVNAKASAEQSKESASVASESALSAKYYSGKPPKPENGTWWIWDADSGGYVNSHIGCELEGPQGVGVDDIQLTEGSHTPGTTDIYTVYLTDGSTKTISVYNGRNGDGSGDVLGITFDLTIPANGWSDGKATIADSRLIALSTQQYFLSANKASRKEFLDRAVEPEDITATGFITFTCETTPTSDLTVNMVRLELAANG